MMHDARIAVKADAFFTSTAVAVTHVTVKFVECYSIMLKCLNVN